MASPKNKKSKMRKRQRVGQLEKAIVAVFTGQRDERGVFHGQGAHAFAVGVWIFQMVVVSVTCSARTKLVLQDDVALVEFRHFMSDLAVGLLDFRMEEADGDAFVLRILFAKDFAFAAAEDGGISNSFIRRTFGTRTPP